MALVKTSNEILEIRGRFGGVYFKKDRYGQHVQAMPRIVKYTRSPAQQGEWGEGSPFGASGISGFSGASALWLLALLAAFGAAWAAFAIANYFATHTGEEKHITGFNWYIYYALAFPECERPPFWKPPHAPGDLPQTICVYEDKWTYNHSPSDWPDYCPADYYWFKGWFGDRPYFGTDNGNWFLWFRTDHWILSKTLGLALPQNAFHSPDENIFARYHNPIRNKHARVYIGGGQFPD